MQHGQRPVRGSMCKKVLLIAVALSGPAWAGSKRPALNETLQTVLPRYELKATNLLEALAQISSQFDIPVGVEWRNQPNSERVVSGEWSDITLESLIKDAVAQDPEYELDISNNVLHIRPRGFGQSPSDFLNIKLQSFRAQNEYTLEIAFRLRDQLNAMLAPRSAKPGGPACSGSQGIGANEESTSLNVKDASVRDILDEVLYKSGYSMWLVTFDPKSTYGGYTGTDSLWRKTTSSDQPNWDFVARYFDPTQMKYRGDWGFRN